MTFKKHIICMVYGLRELKNKSWDNSEWVKNGDFCYYLMRLIATWGASCRHDSASPKTGAWLSLVSTGIVLVTFVVRLTVSFVYGPYRPKGCCVVPSTYTVQCALCVCFAMFPNGVGSLGVSDVSESRESRSLGSLRVSETLIVL